MDFAFRLRAYSAAHLAFDDHMTLAWPDATAILQSEYTGGTDGRAYPVTLLGEIQGEAESLDDAQNRLGGALANVMPLFALAANAAVADPLRVGAYGLDLTNPQPFIWYRTPPASSWFPPGERRITPNLVASLMAAVGHHPQSELLHRAIESYRRALGHWIPEQKLLAGEFLFIAAETLSRCLVEIRAAEKGITPKNLAKLSKVGSPDVLRAQIMRDEIFRDDEAAAEAMNEASNGFEHGYMKVDQVRESMAPVLERSMRHVRDALISAAGVDQQVADQLLSGDYEEPRGLVPVINIIKGDIRRKDPDQPPPAIDPVGVDLEWQSTKVIAERTPSGELKLEMPSEVNVLALPDNAILEVNETGIRAAYIRKIEPPEVS